MRTDISTYTCSGGHDFNDDSYECGKNIFVVADGLGAHENSKAASQFAVSYLTKRTDNTFMMSDGEISAVLEDLNNAVLRMQKETGYKDSRTTIAAAWIGGGKFRCANVGDSRVYYFRNGRIIQHTTDHSVCQAAVKLGEMRSCDIRQSPDRSKLLKVIGENKKVNIAKFLPPIRIAEGDAFLICSDGFWDFVYEEEMELDLHKSSDAKEWLDYMLKRQLERAKNKSDNYTAICGIIHDAPPIKKTFWQKLRAVRIPKWLLISAAALLVGIAALVAGLIFKFCVHTHELEKLTEPICKVSGVDTCYRCKDCGKLYADEQGKQRVSSENIDHRWVSNGIGKTEPAKADEQSNAVHEVYSDEVCSVCEETQHRHLHTLEYIPEKASTCTELGNIAYYRCTDEGCGKLYEDELGEKTVQDVALKELAAHEWVSDGTAKEGDKVYTKEKCKNCSEVKLSDHGHVMIQIKAKAATCTATGNVSHYRCSDCGALYKDELCTTPISNVTTKAKGHTYKYVKTVTEGGELVDLVQCTACKKTATTAHTHQCTEQAKVDPTCMSPGKKVYYVCTNCYKNFADKDGKTPVGETDILIPASAHTYGKEYKHDKEGHWQVCGACGSESTPEKHTSGDKCTVCGYEKPVVQDNTGAKDPVTADTGTTDTGTADTGTADTGTADTGEQEPEK